MKSNPTERLIIGPYRVLQLLGEGGMGLVYLAEQEKPIRRRVAIKLIKVGLDTQEVIARFESERQALALMNHQGIAKIFDAGTTEDGRPYFVMEAVAGIPITEFCDREKLDLRARLQLFTLVCEAIQHAHQKGVIHRDIKPSNVLVQLEDGKPAPKVIDFGVAKAIDQKLTERTLFTQLGVLIGTPAYMSAEQAELSALDVDTRTDVYSLGVLLYELMVGQTPFDPEKLRRAGLEEMLRIIRETDPPLPSERLRTSGEMADNLARLRRTNSPTLVRFLHHDLDWITSKAMEKERTRRYPTVSELGSDIRRFLNDEPVTAGPPSMLYRLRKYARKYRGVIAATAMILLAILFFGSLSLWQGHRAQQAGARASRAASKARAQAIITAASVAQEPLVKALLVRELEDQPDLTLQQLSRVYDLIDTPLPLEVFGEEEPPARNDLAITTAVSPDGERLAVASVKEGAIRVWSLNAPNRPLLLRGHAPSTALRFAVPCLEFSPEGPWLASGGWDRTLRLWNLQNGRSTVLQGHKDTILHLAFSPDGTMIVTASIDATARLWHIDGDPEAISLQGHTGWVVCARFSRDGSQIVTASMDSTARIWSRENWGKSIVLRGHQAPVMDAAFSPDGKRIATASWDGTVRIWEVGASKAPIILETDSGRLGRVVFSPDGQRIVAGSDNGTISIWDAAGRGKPTLLQGHEDSVNWITFGPEGSLFTASSDGTLRRWDRVTPRVGFGGISSILPCDSYRGHTIRLQAMARISSDESHLSRAGIYLRVGNRVTSGYMMNLGTERSIESRDWSPYEIVTNVPPNAIAIDFGVLLYGKGQVWVDAARLEVADAPSMPPIDVEEVLSTRGSPGLGYESRAVMDRTAERGRSLLLERVPVSSQYSSAVIARQRRDIRWFAFARGGSEIITASNDGVAKVWSPAGAREPMVLKAHEDRVGDVAFSPDGQYIATASDDSTARVLRVDGTGQKIVLRGHRHWLNTVAFSADGKKIVTTSNDSTARVWSIADSAEVLVLRGHHHGLNDASFSPDGSQIVTAANDSMARIWSASSGEELGILKGHDGEIYAASYSPDGSRIVTASEDGTARIWNADVGTEFHVLSGHSGEVYDAEFSPDGQRIVTASGDGSARVWSADGQGTPLILRREDWVAVTSARFSPDGRMIVTSSAGDDVVHVWLADGSAEPLLLGDFGVAAAFSPDGQRVAVALHTGDIRLWPVTWSGLLESIRDLRVCMRPEERELYLGESPPEAQERHAQCEVRIGQLRGSSGPVR